MIKFIIQEVKTNQHLGYVCAESEKRAYALALSDQRDEIMCKRSTHGIKLSENGKADAWTEGEETIIWF